MTRRPRRNHTPAFKAKMALAELAQQFDVHANQITQWRSQLLEGAADVFIDREDASDSYEAMLELICPDQIAWRRPDAENVQ